MAVAGGGVEGEPERGESFDGPGDAHVGHTVPARLRLVHPPVRPGLAAALFGQARRGRDHLLLRLRADLRAGPPLGLGQHLRLDLGT